MTTARPRVSRRGWLVAAAAACTTGAFAGPGPAPSRCPVGLQLYSVSRELSADLIGTLRRVRSLGIEEVEIANWAGHAPERFIEAVHSAGLRADSLHVDWAALQGDVPHGVLHARALGATQLVVPAPVFPPGSWPPAAGVDIPALVRRLMTPTQWGLTAAALAEAGQRVHAAGLSLAYHNHGMEFDRRGVPDGPAEIERLLAAADLDVGWELDVGWALAAAEDPVAWIERYGARVHRLHLKEFSPAGARALGDGGAVSTPRVVWRDVLAAARRAGVRAAYVELEPPFHESPWTLIERSWRHLG